MEQATTAMAGSSHFEQLQSALAAVTEGTVPFSDDRGNVFELPRYRRNDADAITRAVLTRSKELGGYIYQLVRVVRLAALCSYPKPYHVFFWSRLAQLAPSYFRNTIQEAKANRRFPDTIVRIAQESTGSDGSREVIEFLEPTMLGGGKSSLYRLSYGNMPPIVALLEIMNYTLTPAVLDKFFQPLLLPVPVATASADEIAQQLHRKFSEWLKLALGSEFVSRQALAIESFLASQSALKRQRIVINDQVILDFWLSQNVNPSSVNGAGSEAKDTRSENMGFKRFRYAAQAMLRYHRAVKLASTNFVEISDFLKPKRRPNAGTEYSSKSEQQQNPALEYWNTEQWRSPIVDLFSPLCGSVKWFPSKEQIIELSNYFDGCDLALKKENIFSLESTEGETSIPPSETPFRAATLTMYLKLDEIERRDGGLMGTDPFDHSFLMTLLRTDVFGAVQNSLTQTLKGATGEQGKIPLPQIVSLLPPENEDHYFLRRRIYSDIRNDLVKTMLASIGQFAQRSLDDLDTSATTAVLALVQKLCQPELKVCSPSVLRFLGDRLTNSDADFNEEEYKTSDKVDWSDVHRSVGKRLHDAYNQKTGDTDVDQFMGRVKLAKNQRQGFRPKDLSDPAIQQAHNQAAFALVALLTELDALDLSLEQYAFRNANTFNTDRQTFADAFADIYGV